MCTGFVRLYVQENEKKETEYSPCLGKDTQLQHRQDLEFVLRIKGSWYFLPSSATFLFFLQAMGKGKFRHSFHCPCI